MIKVRAIAYVVGQVISLQSVLGKIGRLRTRKQINSIIGKLECSCTSDTRGKMRDLDLAGKLAALK